MKASHIIRRIDEAARAYVPAEFAEKGLTSGDFDYLSTFISNVPLPHGGGGGLRRTLSDAFDEAGIPYEMDVPIARGAVASFLVAGRVAVVCAVTASVRAIQRLVERLALSRVEAVVVVTPRAFAAGDEVLGKQLAVIHPGGWAVA